MICFRLLLDRLRHPGRRRCQQLDFLFLFSFFWRSVVLFACCVSGADPLLLYIRASPSLIACFPFSLALMNQRPKIEWCRTVTKNSSNNTVLLHGMFESPAKALLPPESALASFDLLLPVEPHLLPHVNSIDDVSNLNIPVVCVLPPTSDFSTIFRLQLLGKPLAARGIGSLLPTIPFYAHRKPRGQTRACLSYLSDLFAIGAGTVSETMAVFHELRERGFGALGSTGISLGGYVTAALACSSPLDLACVPSTDTGVVFCGLCLSLTRRAPSCGAEQRHGRVYARRAVQRGQLPRPAQRRADRPRAPPGHL